MIDSKAATDGHARPTSQMPAATRMRAIVQDEYGSSEVLELRDIHQPEIGENEVLVRVRAAGVDRGVFC